MIEWMHDWIMGLTSACIITAVAQMLNREGGVARVTRLVCSLVLCAVLFSPLAKLDLDAYSLSLADYRSRAEALTGDLAAQERRLRRVYIEEECAAYILDEAHALGAEGRVEVKAKWREDNWVPWEVSAELHGGADVRGKLSAFITANLAIPEERQMLYVGE